MELRPTDLGNAWLIALVRQRCGRAPDAPPPAPRLGRLGRRWVRGMKDMSSEVAAQTFPLASGQVKGTIVGLIGGFYWVTIAGTVMAVLNHSPGIEIATLAATGALAWLGADYAPGALLRKIHQRPLQEAEIKKLRESLQPANGVGGMSQFIPTPLNDLLHFFLGRPEKEATPQGDGLEDAYLGLVSDILKLPAISPEAEVELRRTMRLLGEAVSSLPLPIGVGNEEARDLIADADALVHRSERETDRVVAESLLRQAQAKATQARAIQNVNRLTRRTRFLREELRAQIAATRAALPSLTQTAASPLGTGELNRVAASVQAVAREAASVFAAQEELAQALGERLPPSSISLQEVGAERPMGRASVWQAATGETPTQSLRRGH